MIVNVEYEDVRYTVTITDNLGKSDSFTGIHGALVEFETSFVKDGHTTVYTVKGEKIDLATYKVQGIENETITVEYVENKPVEPEHIKGDVDGNGALNINDALAVVAILGKSVPETAAADVDGNGAININDALAVIALLGASNN